MLRYIFLDAGVCLYVGDIVACFVNFLVGLKSSSNQSSSESCFMGFTRPLVKGSKVCLCEGLASKKTLIRHQKKY